MVIENEVKTPPAKANAKAGSSPKSKAKASVKAPPKVPSKLAVSPVLVLVVAAVLGVGGYLVYKNRDVIKTALTGGTAAKRRVHRAMLPARSVRPPLELSPAAVYSSHPDDPAFRRQLVDPMSPVTGI